MYSYPAYFRQEEICVDAAGINGDGDLYIKECLTQPTSGMRMQQEIDSYLSSYPAYFRHDNVCVDAAGIKNDENFCI